jgi:hypothetical protein
MEHISGVTGAGPLWHNFMERVLAGKPVQDFTMPAGMVRVEVCDESGLLPTEYCPPDHRHTEIFLAEQSPTEPDNVWQKIKIDRTNGLLATELCPDVIEEKIFAVYPPEARQWAIEHNIPQPPTEYSPNCPIPTGPTATPEPKPFMTITSPREGSYIAGKVPIIGTVQMPNFDRYTIQIGFGHDPQHWILLTTGGSPIQDGVLTTWDTTQFPDGAYTIRLAMYDRAGKSFGGRVKVFVGNKPTPTPRPSPTPTRTLTPSPTSTRTATPLPTATHTLTPSPTFTRTATPLPTATTLPPTSTPPRTATALPPTATPLPTATTLPPTATPRPTVTATTTPSPTLAATMTRTPAAPKKP